MEKNLKSNLMGKETERKTIKLKHIKLKGNKDYLLST